MVSDFNFSNPFLFPWSISWNVPFLPFSLNFSFLISISGNNSFEVSIPFTFFPWFSEFCQFLSPAPHLILGCVPPSNSLPISLRGRLTSISPIFSIFFFFNLLLWFWFDFDFFSGRLLPRLSWCVFVLVSLCRLRSSRIWVAGLCMHGTMSLGSFQSSLSPSVPYFSSCYVYIGTLRSTIP